MTPEDEKPAPRTSAKGKKRADEKYARQAEALRANLRRRKQQQRATSDNEQEGGETDAE